MRCAILGFVVGAAWLQQCAALPGLAALVGCALAVALAARFLRGAPRAMVCGLLCGYCWAAILAQVTLAPELSKSDEGRDIVLVGTIDSLPYRFDEGVRFNFAVERVIGADAVVPPHIALGWYEGRRDDASAIGAVEPGERWQLRVRLQRPHGNANPDGFDYEVWLLEQGLRATGYVRDDAKTNRRIDSFVPGIDRFVQYCRFVLRSRIETALAGKPYAGVIVALVVGDQRAIDQSDWVVFNRTGISHLVSISGLHITMIAGLFAWIAASLWRRSFFTRWQLPLLLPAQKVAALAGAATALVYVLLAGFGVPAQRTLYMLTVVACAIWFGRISSISHVLCVALGVVVLIDPWSVLWPGFWLSFGAVAVILYATLGRTGQRGGGWRQSLHLGAQVQYAVTAGLVPLTMLLFAQVSLVSPIANAVAIPLVSFVVTPLSLAGSLLPAPLSNWLLLAAHACVELLAAFLGWLSGFSFAVWTAPLPNPWVFGWAMLGTVWMLAPRGWPLRWTGAVAWLPLLLQQPSRLDPGQMAVTAFDVGQGMALLIETSGHRLLYDTGPAYSAASNGGERVILPYLKARGITALDGVIVTHSDSDHSGGALTVLHGVATDWMLSSLPAEHPIAQAARSYGHCMAGQRWRWDGVDFEMLHPSAASYADAALKPNARGCTLRITAGGRAILLAADIEAAQEDELLERSPAQLPAQVLLAPHHGSGTSSTLAFLTAVHPAVALFQVGYRNRYHHPKAEVYARYGALGIERIRTDEAGAVTLSFGDTLRIAQYRQQHMRYWYGR